MPRSGNCVPKSESAGRRATQSGALLQGRRANRLKDEVYREMFLLESHRPGAEMALALALLRAIVYSQTAGNQRGLRDWLKTLCPVALRMIEESLRENSNCIGRVQKG